MTILWLLAFRQLHYTIWLAFMPFLLAGVLNFQGTTHLIGVGSLSKLFLYLTEFFAGVSVMAVELGASRLLTPYFSSSQIVWTIIIGIIMIAMALGNMRFIVGNKKQENGGW